MAKGGKGRNRRKRGERGGDKDGEGASGGEKEKRPRGRAENQYEITLARASAKLQVIKRADKQMKQREARGAASPLLGGTRTREKEVAGEEGEEGRRRNRKERRLEGKKEQGGRPGELI